MLRSTAYSGGLTVKKNRCPTHARTSKEVALHNAVSTSATMGIDSINHTEYGGTLG